jgi:hypothetical protein
MEVHRGTACGTPIKEATLMRTTDRDKAQAPTAPKVGHGVGLEASRAELKPRAGLTLTVQPSPEEPGTRSVRTRPFPCPYLCGRPEDRREGAWLETMAEAQTGQPGRKQFIRLGLHMTGGRCFTSVDPVLDQCSQRQLNGGRTLSSFLSPTHPTQGRKSTPVKHPRVPYPLSLPWDGGVPA